MEEFDNELDDLRAWSDERLTAGLAEAARGERACLVTLLLRLGEAMRRELSERRGYASAFDYCTRLLGYSRSGAYRRVRVARVGMRYRSLLGMLSRGDIHLTGAAMIAAHLTPQNHRDVLRRVSGKSEDEIGRIVAAIAPRAAPIDRIRIVSAPKPAFAPEESVTGASPKDTPARPSDRVSVSMGDLFGHRESQEPASTDATLPARAIYDVRFAATERTVTLLHRAQSLLRHRFPQGEIDGIFALALEQLLDKIDRDRKGVSRSSVPASLRAASASSPVDSRRKFPEGVKQAIWERDGGRCAYTGKDGVRCPSRAWLEFDHRKPFALGGRSDAANGRLYCRTHNLLAGRLAFGGPMARSPLA